jgi:hypothetical protein
MVSFASIYGALLVSDRLALTKKRRTHVTTTAAITATPNATNHGQPPC